MGNLIEPNLRPLLFQIILMTGIIGLRVHKKTKVYKKSLFPLDITDYIILICAVIAICCFVFDYLKKSAVI